MDIHPGYDEVAVDIFHTKASTTEFKSHEIHEPRYQGAEHRGLPEPKDATPVTSAIVSIHHILRNTPDWTLEHPIVGTASGKVIIHVEPSKEHDGCSFRFHIRGYSFPTTRRNFLDRPDFFYEIFRKFQDSWRLVYRSEEEKASLSPMWSEDQITLEALCNNDLNRELLIQIVDIEGNNIKELGSFQTTVHGLMGAVSTNGNCDTMKSFPVMNGDRKMGCVIVLMATVITSGRFADESSCGSHSLVVEPSGAFEILPAIAVEILPPPNAVGRSVPRFQDYARKCSIDWCLAIDFTESNGDFLSPSSAHYRTNGRLNDYEWTMSVVGETLRDLNPSQQYPIWGFGGRFQGKTHPIFQCGRTPKANGVSGLLQAYSSTFQTGMTLGNPRKLDNVLLAAAHHAKKQLDAATTATVAPRGSLSYTLLTILLVGSESDVLAVKEKILAIRDAPLSIMVINMPRGGPLDDRKLNIYLSSGRSNCTLIDGIVVSRRDAKTLSDLVLNVLHHQLPSYFHSKGIVPTAV